MLPTGWMIVSIRVVQPCRSSINHVLDAYQLAVAASEYFYEYAMVGTLDMAYPSNAEIGLQTLALFWLLELSNKVNYQKSWMKSFENQ